LQIASAQAPFLRAGRVRHTLLLAEDASIFADALIVNVADHFLVLAEGPSERALVESLSALASRSPDTNASVRGLSTDYVVFGVDGPYSWELLASLLGPIVLGMPYLTLLGKDDKLWIRAGKTGEYGYLLLVPREAADAVEAEILEIGRPLDAAVVTSTALDVCALESWHFSMRMLRDTRLVKPLTPIELQLQWRVSYTRDYVGAAALRARKAEGPMARATCFTAETEVQPGARVLLGEHDAGEILAAARSPGLGCTVGSALLVTPLAHPHLTLAAASATSPGSATQIRTMTASLVHNESLKVKPHLMHTYATRGQRP
jgi:aminomethyltransferase